jgi:hypothetical protein
MLLPLAVGSGPSTPPKLFSQYFSQGLAYCVNVFLVTCSSPTQKGVAAMFVSKGITSTDASVIGGFELVAKDEGGTDAPVPGEEVASNPF